MASEFLQLQFPARQTGRVAIANVTVIPMDSERTLPDQTVVVDGDTIKTVGPASQVDTAGMTVVDGKGKYLMPGLSDMYTHYRDPAEAPLYLAHGITTARTSGNLFQLAMEWAASRGDFPSPYVIAVSPSIDGIGPTGRTDMPHGVPLTRPEDAAHLVQQYVQRGYHQITPFSLLTKENLKALGDAAHAAGVKMVGNCPNAVSWEEAMECGMDGFQQTHLVARDHMLDEFAGQDYWDRFDPAPGTKLDFDKIRRLGALLAEKQVWSLPTLMFHQRASQPVEVSMAHPALRYVPRSTVDDWESTIVRWAIRGRVDVEEWRRLSRIRAEAFIKVAGIFHEEGAPQLPCTDGLNPYNVQGDALHQELDDFVAAGMSAYEALRCATSEAARFMDETERWGTIAEGKRASLILTRANPLQDVRNAREPEAVFVNGYYLPRPVLNELLEQRAAMVNGGPPPPARTDLPSANGTGTPVEAGTWQEMICDAEFGRVSFRHSRLPDGGWLVEERHAGADPRRHPERRSSRLFLAPDLTLRSGEYDVESFVGKESASLSWSETGGYTVKHRAVDGFESERSLPGEARVPSERVAISLVPRLIAEHGESTLPALDAEGFEIGAAEMTLAPADGRWGVKIARLGQRVEQTYSVGPDGWLVGMDETMTLLWPRQLIPVDGGGEA